MMNFLLGIFNLFKKNMSERDETYLKASILLDNIVKNTATSKDYIASENFRLGALCNRKSISQDVALEALHFMLKHCDGILSQAETSREILKTKGAAVKIIAELETLKSTTEQLYPYAKNAISNIERVINEA